MERRNAPARSYEEEYARVMEDLMSQESPPPRRAPSYSSQAQAASGLSRVMQDLRSDQNYPARRPARAAEASGAAAGLEEDFGGWGTSRRDGPKWTAGGAGGGGSPALNRDVKEFIHDVELTRDALVRSASSFKQGQQRGLVDVSSRTSSSNTASDRPLSRTEVKPGIKQEARHRPIPGAAAAPSSTSADGGGGCGNDDDDCNDDCNDGVDAGEEDDDDDGGYWAPRLEKEMEAEREAMLKRLGMRGLRDNVLIADRFVVGMEKVASLALEENAQRALNSWREWTASEVKKRQWNRGSAFKSWKGEVVSMCASVAGANAMQLEAFMRLLRVIVRHWRMAIKVRRGAQTPLLLRGIQAMSQNVDASFRISRGLARRRMRDTSDAFRGFCWACDEARLRRRGVEQTAKMFKWVSYSSRMCRIMSGWRRVSIASLTLRVILSRAKRKNCRRDKWLVFRAWSWMLTRVSRMARAGAATRLIRRTGVAKRAMWAWVRLRMVAKLAAKIGRRLLISACDAWWDAAMDRHDDVRRQLEGKKGMRRMLKVWAWITRAGILSNNLAGHVARSSALGINYGQSLRTSPKPSVPQS